MAVHATEVSLEVVRTMFRYAGARSLYAGNIVDRCLRDVTAASQHGMVNEVAYEARAGAAGHAGHRAADLRPTRQRGLQRCGEVLGWLAHDRAARPSVIAARAAARPERAARPGGHAERDAGRAPAPGILFD